MKRTAPAETNGRDVRVERLRASRTQDSEAKTARALDAVRGLLRAGRRITIAQVARDASVSTWFVYNQPQVRDAVQTGMATQREQGLQRPPTPGRQQVSPAGLQTELALARDEIRDLKKERDQLRQRVRLSLGAEIEEADRHRLVERVQQLERDNASLNAGLASTRDQLAAMEGRLRETEDDLTAARAGLRRAMRSVPPQ
ncbi:DUF6262 family protein [Streptomyces xanthophaeus]|uniref:DUF6262 family protein n=1 Tax=Streptomyces xanthophaeus TaxID=67385 RepID=UPI0038647A6E|nr:DUF6262 family protein [Streptomyces xanthophaeus]WST63493.1 DUF6262 family protein [Streptomyces xanthophaeus]